jgi:hypothetical protein
MPNLGRYENTQRVERADMELVGDSIPRNVGAALPAQFLTNPAGQAAWIMSGFAVSNPALKQCRVDRGVALLQTKENGAVERGMLAYEGVAFINLDLAAYANGTYSVYIRFELVDGDFQNRIFWTGAAEAASNIATKRVAGWGLRVELVSPGSEWFKIGEVVVSASPTLAVTNKRFFYFEGEEANATPYAKTWGGGSDRNSNRATNGVKDMQTFVQAVQVQLESIMGTPQRWWETPTVALNQKLTKTGGDTLSGTHTLDGTARFAGNFLPDTNGTRVLGGASNKWDAVLNGVTLDTLFFNGSPAVVDDFMPFTDSTYDLGRVANRWAELHVDDIFLDNDILPVSDNTGILGSASLTWNNIHAQRITLYELPDGNTSIANALTASSIIKAWGLVNIIAGVLQTGVNPGGSGIMDGHNITSVAIDANSVNVTLGADMASTNFIVIANGEYDGGALNVIFNTANKTTGGFELVPRKSDGSIMAPNAAGTTIEIEFIVLGRQ